MRVQIGPCTLELAIGDVTQQEVDAVVNAANSALAGGGGVDGAIHRAGGPSIMAETAEKCPDGCPTGQAVITGAGSLKAAYVIHAVGPVWSGGQRGEPDLLAAAYRNSLQVAVDNACQSVAFPSLSTGAYRYPVDAAARTALHAVVAFMLEHEKPALARLVLFSPGIYGAYAAALEELLANEA